MKFRKLRIAFSATCLIACVLLIVLWVRSYWKVDSIDNAESVHVSETKAIDERFLREIQGLSARFDVVRVDGEDYRHRGRPISPEPYASMIPSSFPSYCKAF